MKSFIVIGTMVVLFYYSAAANGDIQKPQPKALQLLFQIDETNVFPTTAMKGKYLVDWDGKEQPKVFWLNGEKRELMAPASALTQLLSAMIGAWEPNMGLLSFPLQEKKEWKIDYQSPNSRGKMVQRVGNAKVYAISVHSPDKKFEKTVKLIANEGGGTSKDMEYFYSPEIGVIVHMSMKMKSSLGDESERTIKFLAYPTAQ